MLHHYQAGTISARLKRWIRMRKKSYKKRENRRKEFSRVSSSDTATTAERYLSPAFFIVLPVRNHGYVFSFYVKICVYVTFE